MKVCRLLAASLLLGVIVIGFREGSSAEPASAIFRTTSHTTSYSTTTSTSYAYVSVAMATSTLYSTSEWLTLYPTPTTLHPLQRLSWVVTTIPTATRTYFELRTRTHVYTYTTEYVSTTELFSVGPTETVLILVLVGIPVAAAIFFMKRPKRSSKT